MAEGGAETLMRDPPPRRGAPFAPSEVSIPTRPEGHSDQDDEQDEGNQENEAAAEVDYVDQEMDDTRLAVMADGLTDAHRLSDDLWTRLVNSNYESRQYLALLNMKRKQFRAIREEYEDPSIAPFVDTRRLGALDEQTGGSGAAFTILRKMNLASALEILDRIIRNEAADLPGFLQALSKGVYPFLLNGDPDRKFDPQTVLEIYTHILIEKLAADKTNRPSFAIIAEVFCDGGDSEDYSELFSHGPFVSLGESPEEVMIADRIQEIVPFVKKRGRGVSELREKYDLEDFLKDLRDFVLNAWPNDPEVYYDAADQPGLQGTPNAFDARASQQYPGSAPARYMLLHQVLAPRPLSRS